MKERFSLYGFLRNQKYYEPFLLLAFLDRGLDYFMIGLLISFRQVWVNLLEIPSGFIADSFGRRFSLIASFIAYILSFIIFAQSAPVWTLFIAMFLFAIGEAFRTGTHKAMIFAWLDVNGRADEKIEVYGYTRSWSQIGSAISLIIATAAVLTSGGYRTMFYLAIPPYLINIVNLLGYPSFLDNPTPQKFSFRQLVRRFSDTLGSALKNRSLRALFLESMIVRGNSMLIKDYLQPMLKEGALVLPLFLALAVEKRSALLIGAVYFILYLVSGLASRNAHLVVMRLKGEKKTTKALVALSAAAFVIATASLLMRHIMPAALMFTLVVILQNIWRPILVSRIDEASDSKMGATVMSINSQVGSFYVMICAPLLGLAVDALGLISVAAFGILTSLAILIRKLNVGGER